eukprot:scaffold55684_cov101-Phaeocystis_antarctica.AAC.9
MKTSYPLLQPHASAAIRRRIWSREHRASCGGRMRCPSRPRACLSASSATLRCARLACARSNGGRSSVCLSRHCTLKATKEAGARCSREQLVA